MDTSIDQSSHQLTPPTYLKARCACAIAAPTLFCAVSNSYKALGINILIFKKFLKQEGYLFQIFGGFPCKVLIMVKLNLVYLYFLSKTYDYVQTCLF